MGRETGKTTLFHLADLAYNGRLATKLDRWRATGVSLRSVQAIIQADLDVKIALETIRRWYAFIDAEAA